MSLRIGAKPQLRAVVLPLFKSGKRARGRIVMFFVLECAACLLLVATVVVPAFTVIAVVVALDEGAALCRRQAHRFGHSARILVAAIRSKLSAIRSGLGINEHQEASDQ